ncbi:MAG TPA: N-(5'-phosphoribosyl)anthranilate isomerase [Planctomycetes bacterium]|nr:N-(5'-phosphoribosyl)anthranilate isomerase [Planctomycetota bacterium]
MRVKICGFTRPEDVLAALDAGVDAIGLNLARGPRRISLDQAVALAALVPPMVQVVALFVDADEDAIQAALAATRCTVVQLHGDEPPELAERLRRRVPVIKAFRIAGRADLDRVAAYPADAVLLDAAVPGVHGGSGRAWDHGLLAQTELRQPVILAGGLGPDNVAAAIAATRPWAVDTASGVESAPGLKDAARMRAFVVAAHQA